jgi:PAS domain S-box-containing protein
VVLVYFVRRRKDVPFTHVFWLFGAFILGCGFTHFMDVLVTYLPLYWLAGFVKLFTAVVSLGTVAALVSIVPRALALRSPEELEHEIVERKRAEKELAEKNRQLVKSEQLKSQFLANVSHELRTPLTLILGPLEGLLTSDRGAAPTADRATLQTIHNNAVRLLQMVNGLLDFSKLEAGKVEVKREPIDVEALTRALLADFQPLMQRKGLACRFEVQPPRTTVLLDRYLFERILFNLLSNAVKFTPAGGTVTVSLAVAHDRLRLNVTDTGIGISEENIANLFQKFRQLEASTSRRFEGTGLGLALVQEFAELLEGRVAVSSRPGQGSTFTVDCAAPVHAPADTGQTPTHAAVLLPRYEVQLETNGPAASASESLPKVLIVEDNVELAGYVARLLRGSCQTQIAGDGGQALALIGAGLPDLILADVMMPNRDGLSLCRAVKSDPASAGIPVVLLTALTHREALLQGWEAGADEYLFKPFHPTELLTRIKSVLAGSRTRRRAEPALQARRAAMLEASLDAIICMDQEGKIIDWNPAAEQIFGYPRAAVLGRDMAEWIVPRHMHEAYRQGLAHYLATGEGPVLGKRIEMRALRADGTEFPVELAITRIAVEGPPTFLGYIRDITERKRAEERFRLAVESAPSAMVMVNQDGQIVLVNTQTEQLFGYERRELLGQSVELLVPEHYRGKHPGYRAGFFARPETRAMGVGRDLYGRRKDGSEFPVEVGLNPIQTDEGTLVLSAIVDITERKRAENAIRHLNVELEQRVAQRTAQLEAANKELEAFSYSVSHDLRAPLRAIDGFSRILLDKYPERVDAVGQDCLRRVGAATQRLAQLIDDLLKLSRVTLSEMQLGTVDLSALAEVVTTELQQREPQRQVEFVLARGVVARGDPALLRIVLVNLLGNAWKFTGTRAAARIEFGITARNGQTIYFVRDNGAGFDMAYAGKLFEAFQRLHSTKEFPGNGIGLATVQRIVRRHGGQVWAEGAVEQGATFYFTL